MTTSLTRLYGRIPGGERIQEAAPGGRGSVLTMLGALSLRGVHAMMTTEALANGDIFCAFLAAVLCPKLTPGDVVVLDNLGVHKIAGVRPLVEACGVRLLYLPPYSPDLNPIEKAWSKLKTLLRAAKARSQEALQAAIAELLADITSSDAHAWLRHCGIELHHVSCCS